MTDDKKMDQNTEIAEEMRDEGAESSEIDRLACRARTSCRGAHLLPGAHFLPGHAHPAGRALLAGMLR